MTPKFEEIMETEEGCSQLLFQGKFPKGFRCACGGKKYSFGDFKTVRCRQCKTRVSLTKGGFFYRLRIPIVKAFKVLHGFAVEGKSVCRLARECGLPYSTVWRLVQKVRAVFEAHSKSYVGQRIKVSCAEFRQILFKRTREPYKDFGDLAFLPVQSADERADISRRCDEIIEQHQGIGRKHAQLYITERSEPIKKLKSDFGSLLRLLALTESPTNKEIENYSSPIMLRLDLAA